MSRAAADILRLSHLSDPVPTCLSNAIHVTSKIKMKSSTIFVVLLVLATGQCQRPVDSWIQSTRITNWGTWGEEALCPEGAFVTGFRLKVQPDQSIIRDDTSLNAVELICSSETDAPTHIMSGEGARGSWGSFSECVAGTKVNGFQLRSESITLDNTAANNLAIYCDGVRREGNGLDWGDWTEMLTCPSNTHVCGIKTQIAVSLPTVNDDTALNNVDMACCRE